MKQKKQKKRKEMRIERSKYFTYKTEERIDKNLFVGVISFSSFCQGLYQLWRRIERLKKSVILEKYNYGQTKKFVKV